MVKGVNMSAIAAGSFKFNGICSADGKEVVARVCVEQLLIPPT